VRACQAPVYPVSLLTLLAIEDLLEQQLG